MKFEPDDEDGDLDAASDLQLKSTGAYFPQCYVTGFFEFLKRNSDRIQVMTYADLPWLDDYDVMGDYPRESAAWNALLKAGVLDKRKCYVFLQYDVDSRPERTMSLLRHPSHRGVPASVMIFNRRIDRRRLKMTGEVGFTDYEIDDQLLQELEMEGFLVGYHSNAYEQSHFDTDRALELFDSDIRALSTRFDLRFFSAHGGVAGPDGRNNRDLPMSRRFGRHLRWVHNGHTPKFSANYSDGGHNSPLRDPRTRDLRDFVQQFSAGRRYRILLHPQYYDPCPGISKRFAGTAWYDELMRSVQNSPSYDPWALVSLKGRNF